MTPKGIKIVTVSGLLVALVLLWKFQRLCEGLPHSHLVSSNYTGACLILVWFPQVPEVVWEHALKLLQEKPHVPRSCLEYPVGSLKRKWKPPEDKCQLGVPGQGGNHAVPKACISLRQHFWAAVAILGLKWKPGEVAAGWGHWRHRASLSGTFWVLLPIAAARWGGDRQEGESYSVHMIIRRVHCQATKCWPHAYKGAAMFIISGKAHNSLCSAPS